MHKMLKRYLHLLWIRKGELIGYLVLGIISIGTILELEGVINLVPAGNGESEISNLSPVINAFGTVALSFGLLLLYARQTRMLEQQYKPHLSGEIASLNPVASQFVVKNSGSDFAYDVEAEWELGGEKRQWEKTSLGPGEDVGFPLVVDEDGGWIVQTARLRQYFEENNIDEEFEYRIECRDQFGVARNFSGTVDFNIMNNREDSHEIWQTDPMESMEGSLANIEASIEAIASDINDKKEEEEWQDRWSKHQAIINIVQEQEEVSIDALRRMVDTRIGTLEYRLSELENAGYLAYDDTAGVVKARPGPGENSQLSKFNESK